MLELVQGSRLVTNRDEMRNLGTDIQEVDCSGAPPSASRNAREEHSLGHPLHHQDRQWQLLPGFTPACSSGCPRGPFVLVDAHEAEIRGRRRPGQEPAVAHHRVRRDILEHKLINRAYAAAFSARSGCLLPSSRTTPATSARAVDEFVATLRFIGVEQYTKPNGGKGEAGVSPRVAEGLADIVSAFVLKAEATPACSHFKLDGRRLPRYRWCGYGREKLTARHRSEVSAC